MHFATSDIERFGADAAIWVVDYVKVHKLLPEKLTAALAEEGANTLTVEMLSGAVGSLEDLNRMQPENFLGFLESPRSTSGSSTSTRSCPSWPTQERCWIGGYRSGPICGRRS